MVFMKNTHHITGLLEYNSLSPWHGVTKNPTWHVKPEGDDGIIFWVTQGTQDSFVLFPHVSAQCQALGTLT